MPRAVKIHLDDGSILTGRDMGKHLAVQRSIEKAKDAKILRAHLRGETPDSIMQRFNISRPRFQNITRHYNMCPQSRAEIEAILLQSVGKMVADHEVAANFLQDHLVKIMESEKKEFVEWIKDTPKGTERKKVPKAQALLSTFREIMNQNKTLIANLANILPKEFVLHLGDRPVGASFEDLEAERRMLLEQRDKVATSEEHGHA